MINSLIYLQKNFEKSFSKRGTASEISRKTGIATGDVSNIVSGKTIPSIGTLDKIANALNLKTWELLKPPDDKNSYDSRIKNLPQHLREMVDNILDSLEKDLKK